MIRQANELNRRTATFGLRLKFYFAVISCLGGVVLASGTDGSALSVIAVFFAIFGFVFVDWLEFFALPSVAAYATMGVAAMYCVGDFVELNAPGQHQMGVVAQLLVFVQSILMLQKKSRRIFEQLGVFCLLELTVAAVFNDALLFGVLLLPIALLGAMALTLTAGIWVTEGQSEPSSKRLTKKTNLINEPRLDVNSDLSWSAIFASASKSSRIVLWMLTPAVLLISIIFFYALPRTTDAARVESRGKAMVGFSDELRLGQIGRMMQSTQPALRIKLRESETGQPYSVIGGLYLRGRVLERYEDFNRLTMTGASWKSLPAGYLSASEKLPEAVALGSSLPTALHDAVDVKIVCESMRSNALFALAPYHNNNFDSEVRHTPELWALHREGKPDWIYPRLEYSFGTQAFRDGVQSDLKSFWHRSDPLYREGSQLSKASEQSSADQERKTQSYIEQLLAFSPMLMPTIDRIGESLVEETSGTRRPDYSIAKAMERHFTDSGKYQYTLNLDAEPVPGLDPIEQFVRIDQRGHCQYFASALAMMLRSQGIPARVIAGYHTDEYNDIARHFVARQLHAHAWVEALINVTPGDGSPATYGELTNQKYWLRLDPTPSSSRVRETSRAGQVIDLAQTVWDDYVVEMDGERQETALQTGGSNSMNQSYQQVITKLTELLDRLRTGRLGGGALANRKWFSWQAAVAASLLMIGLLGVLRINLVRRRRAASKPNQIYTMVPSLQFYAEAVVMVSRLGITPVMGQTPKEFSEIAILRFREAGSESAATSLRLLTDLFYHSRYGDRIKDSGIAKVSQIVDASRSKKDPSLTRPSEKGSSLENQAKRALANLAKGVEMILQREEKGN